MGKTNFPEKNGIKDRKQRKGGFRNDPLLLENGFLCVFVLLTTVILGVVGLFSWAEGGPTKKLGLSPFQETQYVYVDRGITVPVSGKAAQGTIRALAEDLRYDDLLDLYPSMGTWPHRMTEVGQVYFPTCFVMRQGKDAWALSLIGRSGHR